MKNKDLFDAIHNVDESYIASAWENTEADHPIVLRPEKRSAKKTVRNIMLGVGGTAAAAAVGLAVIAGANGFSLKSIIGPASSGEFGNSSHDNILSELDNPNSNASLFDPNAPLPVNIVAPDGNLLTYNDLVNASINGQYRFWETGETAEEIAQMDELFENFFDIISKNEYGEGFWNTGYVYLPEPGSDKLKRYNTGDMYCGLKIDSCSSSFDENGKYFNGSVDFERSDELIGVEVTRTGEYDFQKSYPSTNDVSDNFHFSGYDCYSFISNDPKLTALTNGLNNEFIEGKISISTDIPLNTPVNATIDCLCLKYCADEDCYCNSDKPTITFLAMMRGFEAYDESLKQWLEKGLAAPYASAPDDFNFLCDRYIDIELGSDIYAVDDGEVIDKNADSVVIKHGENLYTTYYLIDVSVDVGDEIKAGDAIGVANYEYDKSCEFAYKFTLNQPDLSQLNLMY